MMKRKLRVYQEDVKTQHTDHWDWDYLTWKEIEDRLNDAGVGKEKQIAQTVKSHKQRKSMFGIGVGIGLLVATVLVLVIMIR